LERRLKIAIIEDNQALLDLVSDYLLGQGHDVLMHTSAEQVFFSDQPIDLYLVDVNLPGEDGISLTARLRQRFPQAGIIMISARTQEMAHIAGYESGADLYLPKPFSLEQLNAAIGALARRLVVTAPVKPGLKIHRLGMRISGTLLEVALTASELSLLELFARKKGVVHTYPELGAVLGKSVAHNEWQSMAVMITRLRKKLVQAGAPERCIVSVRGVGYQCSIDLNIF
jgi:DNA-binding response OmpR family regulator